MIAVAVLVLGARPGLDLAQTRHAMVFRQVGACFLRHKRSCRVQVVVGADVLLSQLVAIDCGVAEYRVTATSCWKVFLGTLRVKGCLVCDVARRFQHLFRL